MGHEQRMARKVDVTMGELVELEREKLWLTEAHAMVAELIHQGTQARDSLWAAILFREAERLADAARKDDEDEGYEARRSRHERRASDYIDVAVARRAAKYDPSLRRYTQVLPPTLDCEHCGGFGIEPNDDRRCRACRDGEILDVRGW